MYPRVLADIPKLQHNANRILSWCRAAGISAVFVGKCITEDPAVLPHVLKCGFAAVADSREENLLSITCPIPKMLLRIGMPDRADLIVSASDISLQSELRTIDALGKAAERRGEKHKIILMIDLGDLREGLYFENKAAILEAARFISRHEWLELYGIGTNLTCYGSVVPDRQNLTVLTEIADWLRKELNETIPVVAGGNSSSLYPLLNHEVPEGINLLRIGEAVLLGTNTYDGSKFAELYDDAFLLEAEVVEVQVKPSFPVGKRSVDAFGKTREYTDSGEMIRGILAIGRQDLPVEEMIPVDPRISVLGGSSDHVIVDLRQRPDVQVGDVLQFKLSYGGLLGCYTSRYVAKCVKTS